jgi:hypothetical protein
MIQAYEDLWGGFHPLFLLGRNGKLSELKGIPQ